MKRFIVAESTGDLCGVELVEEEEFVVLRDFDSPIPRGDYLIHKEDVSKLIEGLQEMIKE